MTASNLLMQWQVDSETRQFANDYNTQKVCWWNESMIDIYFLLLLTQVHFLGATFYFLESTNFENYFNFLESSVLGKYLHFLKSTKLLYFWQDCELSWVDVFVNSVSTGSWWVNGRVTLLSSLPALSTTTLPLRRVDIQETGEMCMYTVSQKNAPTGRLVHIFANWVHYFLRACSLSHACVLVDRC